MSHRNPPVNRSVVSRVRAIILSGLLVVLSLVVGLALIEGVLAFLVPPPIVWKSPQESYIPDPKVGHRLEPGQHSYTHSFPVITNSYGMRDREFSAVPDTDVTRVLCVGDSLTFGDGVAVEDTYPKQLETLLADVGESKYEVINAGDPSWDTWQEVVYFEEWGIHLKPKIVVIGFYGNDIVPKPEKVKGLLTGDGTLRRQGLGGMFSDSAVHTLKSSRLLLVLKDSLGKVYRRIYPSAELSHQQAMLEGTEDDFLERGWREVDASIGRMANLKEEHDFTLVLAIFPMAEQLLRDYPQAQYQSRIRAIAEKYGIPSIDLMDAFEREFAGFGSLFIEWDGHPNPNAHRIAAEEIANFIRTTPQSVK